MDDGLRLNLTIRGRVVSLTPERARRVARRMAEREADDAGG